MKTNVLYYGDNLDILRRYIPDESVDLIYLDPPFNSNAAYSVIFKDESGRGSDAQITAFDDTWHWGPDAERQYLYLTNNAYNGGKVPGTVSAIVGAFHAGIKPSPMLAYLVEMAVRLVELHRVLRPTGSLYLHCDPTASHYLKLVLDAVFGPTQFRSEVTWRRTNIHNDAKVWSPIADILLYYVKDARSHFTWNRLRTSYDPAYLASKYRYKEPDGRVFRLSDMRSPHPRPNLMYEWKGYKPHPNGWAYSKETMQRLDDEGRIWYPNDFTKRPYLKRYLDKMPGAVLANIWTDIDPINSMAKERLGYPTQKPVALLERVIEASSKPGDIVLDPFCGCGTALIAAQKLGRRWTGIDITYLAIAVMKARLKDSFAELDEVEVVNRPTEVAGARAMVADGSLEHRYQFQWWVLDLVGATPVGDFKKKGADKGRDGMISFSGAGGKAETCIVSVKSGGVGSAVIDELKGAMERHGAAMGLLVTLEEPSKPMVQNATEAGFHHSDVSGRDYPRVQIMTIRELLEEGKKPSMPLLVLPTYQQAPKVLKAAEQAEMFGG